MAIGRCRKKQLQCQYEQSLCRCVVAIFQVAVFCQSVSSITAQGFMQSNVEADGIVQHSRLYTDSESEKLNSQAFQLDPNKRVTSQADVIRFDPPFLDFDVQPIGIPSMRIVYVFNPSKTKSLRLNAISARTSHFHSSFFDKKEQLLCKAELSRTIAAYLQSFVPPGGNASFEVVFLARVVGNVENTLFINTVTGTFSYQVFGVGTPNPYRLRPFLGAKVSLNSTFSSLITIHNPTGTPLQVTEMYTSSGFLHLQLPTGMDKGVKQLWEIPPYETRPVMQASFLGKVADNHTAFIRIKTNRTDFAQNVIVPLEVEVTTAPGIYSSLEMLDFGTLRSKDQPKTLNLFLLNSGSKEVQIGSISVQPSNPALKIDFKPIRLESSDSMFTSVANISFNAQKVHREDQWNGKIVIRSKEKSYAELALSYQVNILTGNLGYDETCTYFHVPAQNSSRVKPQNITITNTFFFPVILHRLELPADTSTYFQVVNFSSPCTVPAQSSASCFSIECLPSSFHSLNSKNLDTRDPVHHVILHTNASTFSMPLQAYTGLLTFKVQNENLASLDFGIMGTVDKRQMLVALFNHNPVEVSLFDFNSSLPGVDVNVITLTKNDVNVKSIVRSYSKNILLPPGSRLTLEVVLTAPNSEQVLTGNLTFFTNYQKLEIPIKARVAIGSLTLKPPKFKFPPTFPGMLVYHTLSVTSSFAQTIKIESLTCEDKRFYYRKHKNVGSELEPGKELKIGKVYFDARLTCKPGRCYVGLLTSTTVGHHWLSTLSLGKNAAEVDLKLYKSHQQQWQKLKEENLTSISTTFQLSTNLVRNFYIEAAAALYWPSLVAESIYEFPLTHIGKKSVIQVTLHNPSDVPVIVQILPISLYPQPHVTIEALQRQALLDDDGFIFNDSTLFNVSLSADSSSQDTSQMMWLEYTLSGNTNKSCVNLFLNPNQRQVIDVSFFPHNDSLASTLILLRNNLTILDAFEVKGRGVQEILKLGGKLSHDQNSSLRFKLTKTLLRDCFVDNRKDKEAPSYTVRKSFTAKNLGMLNLQVRHMMIDRFPCEGYGFRVLDCVPFVLLPNETKEITIVYTPDFTVSQVSHALQIYTSQGNLLTFNLNVTLPHHLLSLCQESVPRPDWEGVLYFCFVCLTILGFVGIVLIAYLEAMTKLQPYVMGREESRKPFNLQEIANNLGNMNGNNSPNTKKKRKKSFHMINMSIPSIINSVSNLARNYLKFDVFSFLRKPPVALRTDVESREPSITDLLDSNNQERIEPETVFASPTFGANNGRVRNRQNRKSKSNNNSPNQNANGLKNKNHLIEKKPVFSPPLSWTIISASKSKTDSATKLNDDDKTETASASSIDSSSSRGSSGSSGPLESSRRETSDFDNKSLTKRKRKSKSLTTYSRDTDESSTTTEKSSEDYDGKQSTNKRESMKYKPKPTYNKNGSDSDINRMPVHYINPSDSNLRHRHVRTNQKTPKNSYSNHKSPFNQDVTFRTDYDNSSSTEEPSWDFPKLIINKQGEADDAFQSLSENTHKQDKKMRPSPRNRNQYLPNNTRPYNPPPSLLTDGFQNLVTKPSSSHLKQTNKGNLSKAQSMPEKPSPPTRQYSHSYADMIPNRRKSNNDTFGPSTFNDNGHYLSTFSPTSTVPGWNGFSQNYEGFVSQPSTVLSQPVTDLGTPHWPVYNQQPTSTTASWTPDIPFQISLPLRSRSPGTSSLSPPATAANNLNIWGSANPSPTPRSTHEIWSVSNAVTMDEDRNTAENDPLGLKSIWNQNAFDGRKQFY